MMQQSQTASDLVARLMKLAEEESIRARPLPPVTCSLICVRRDMYGRLIGKGGENMKLLRKMYPDVSIDVPKAGDGGHPSLEGPEDKVMSAAQYILTSLGLQQYIPSIVVERTM
mmetsp:Transcript_36889/g.99026  ORF Transcript_36889/g.99026 Transcript_36889/m.99026 type:complete len:114 (-) Transcript_36889:517-858(-)